MKQAVSSPKSTTSRKRLLKLLVTGGMALGAILVAAGPAAAVGNGKGAFTGVELAPNPAFVNPPLPSLCAKYTASAADELKEKMHMKGTLTYNNGPDKPGQFLAVYTKTSGSYYASPVGTFATQAQCTSVPPGGPGPGGGGVPVSSDASPTGFQIYEEGPLPGVVGTTPVCTGSGTYERHATSAITLVFNGSCGGTTNTTTVTFTGTEEPCPNPTPLNVGCPDPANPIDPTLYQALLDGVYVQS